MKRKKKEDKDQSGNETNNFRLWLAFGLGLLASIPLHICVYLLWRII